MINNRVQIFKKLIIASIFLIGAIFIESCNDAPVQVRLTQDTLALASISSSSYNLVSGYEVYKVGNTGRLNNSQFIFGSADDFNVYSFLRFYIPDYSTTTFTRNSTTITFDELNPEDIEFARLVISPGDYAYGDIEGNQNFEFTLFEGSTGLFLDETGITNWEDIQNDGGITDWIRSDNRIADVSHAIDKNSTTYSFEEDIEYDPIIIDLKATANNPNLVFDWLNEIQNNREFSASLTRYIVDNNIDFTNNDLYDFSDRDSIRRIVAESMDIPYDSLVGNFSLGLFPNENSRFIQRFWSTDYSNIDNFNGDSTFVELRPRIEYKFTFDPPDTIRTIEAVNFFYVNDEPDIPQNEMFVQNLLSRRLLLDIDLSALPEQSSIVSAQLKLTIDKERSKFGSNGEDLPNWALTYLFPQTASSNTFIEEELLSLDPTVSRNQGFFFTKRGELQISYYKEEDGDDVILFNNLAISLDLIDKEFYRSQLMIVPYYRRTFSSEIFFADKLVFYGPDASDESKRPFLNVVYQQWQEE